MAEMIELDLKVIRELHGSYTVEHPFQRRIGEATRIVYLPKSQVHVVEICGDCTTFEVPRWLAEKEDMV